MLQVSNWQQHLPCDLYCLFPPCLLLLCLVPKLLPHPSWVIARKCTMWHIAEWRSVLEIKESFLYKLCLFLYKIAPRPQRRVFGWPVLGVKWARQISNPQSPVDGHKDVHTWSARASGAKGSMICANLSCLLREKCICHPCGSLNYSCTSIQYE